MKCRNRAFNSVDIRLLSALLARVSQLNFEKANL